MKNYIYISMLALLISFTAEAATVYINSSDSTSPYDGTTEATAYNDLSQVTWSANNIYKIKGAGCPDYWGYILIQNQNSNPGTPLTITNWDSDTVNDKPKIRPRTILSGAWTQLGNVYRYNTTISNYVTLLYVSVNSTTDPYGYEIPRTGFGSWENTSNVNENTVTIGTFDFNDSTNYLYYYPNVAQGDPIPGAANSRFLYVYSTNQDGIQFDNSDYTTFNNLDVSYAGFYGIFGHEDSDYGTVTNCITNYNGHHYPARISNGNTAPEEGNGIHFTGDYCYGGYNTAWYNHDNGGSIENTADTGAPKMGVLEHNNFSYNEGHGATIHGCTPITDINDIAEGTIRNNIFIGNGWNANYGTSAVRIHAGHGTVTSNLFANNCGAALKQVIAANTVVTGLELNIFNNLIYDNNTLNCADSTGENHALMFNDFGANIIRIWNNTIVGGVSVIRQINNGSNANIYDVRNNILKTTTTTSMPIEIYSNPATNTGTFTNNVMLTAHTSSMVAKIGSSFTEYNLSGWNALAYVGTDINSNPDWVNEGNDNYKLKASSLLINAGTVSTLALVPLDYIGVTRDALPDIGAYEFRGSLAIPSVASNTWTLVPLRTQAQKDAGHAGGEGLQMLHGLSWSPSNANVIYVCNDTGQVWKSSDGGTTWVSKRNGLPANGGASIVVDPDNADVAFVAANISTVSAPTTPGSLDGIYYTTDGGDTWTLSRLATYHRVERGQYFAFTGLSGGRNMTIYAGTSEEGLLKSTNGGVSWTSPFSGSIGNALITDVELHAVGGNTYLYVCVSGTKGVYKITNDGTPTLMSSGFPDTIPITYPRSIAVTKHATDQALDILYAACSTSGVYKSTDGGSNWSAINTGLDDLTQDWSSVEVSPANASQLYVKAPVYGGMQPYRSSNAGSSWSPATSLDVGVLSTRLSNSLLTSQSYNGAGVACHPSVGGTAIGFVNNTIMKTTDGGQNWVYSGSGYCGGRAIKMWFNPANVNHIRLFLLDHGMIESTNGGDTWDIREPVSASYPSSPMGCVDPDNSNRIITYQASGTSAGTAYLSTNGGTSWSAISGIPSDGWVFASFYPTNHNYVAVAGQTNSYVSADKGATWTTVSNIQIKAISPSDSSIVYGFHEVSGQSATFWKSTNYGLDNWTQLSTPSFNDAMDVAITDDNTLIVASNNGVRKWNGTTWSTINGTAPNNIPTDVNFGTTNVLTVSVKSTDANDMLVGMTCFGDGQRKTFLYETFDGGTTWGTATHGLLDYDKVWGMGYNLHTGKRWISTNHGNYKRSISYSVTSAVIPGAGISTVIP